MTNVMNTIVLTLLEAQVTLYQQTAAGGLGAALYSGSVAENLKVAEQWLKVETRPTGARYPAQHLLVAQYTVSIERLWSLPLAQLAGFMASQQNYVLDIIWTEEETGQWHRRTFYGVTIANSALAAKDIESGHTDNQEFQAQYYVPGGGGLGQIQPPVQTVPQYVLYRGTDGITTNIYGYAAGVFADTITGSPNPFATIASDGSTMTFAGAGSPALATASGVLDVPALHDFLPVTLPRLEFYYGATLLAVLTPDGFWAATLNDGTLPSSAAGQFVLSHSGTPVAVIAPGGTTALTFAD